MGWDFKDTTLESPLRTSFFFLIRTWRLGVEGLTSFTR